MNIGTVLMRLNENEAPKVSKQELKLLANHINYLESVCESFLKAITDAGLKVSVPSKALQGEIQSSQDKASRGDEWARD